MKSSEVEELEELERGEKFALGYPFNDKRED